MKFTRSTTIAALLTCLALPVAAQDGDAEKGEKVFKKCKACHAIGEGAKNKIGPLLTGIVDNDIAAVEDFKYSKAFLAKKEEGLVWTAENLDAFMKKPKKFIEGTKMSFAGVRKEEQRIDLITYLLGFEPTE